MSGELILYTNPMSRGRVARWMLEELGQLYRAEIVDYGAAMKSDAYRAINPMGKVPALKHGTTIVTECAAICAYLADAFPAAGLAPPPASADRGPYYRWLMFGAGPLEAAATNKALGFVTPAERSASAGYGSLDLVTDTLETALAGRTYVAGDGFTAADLYLAAQLGWLSHFGMIEKRPAIMAYVGTHTSRPAFKAAAAKDDALLPPKT